MSDSELTVLMVSLFLATPGWLTNAPPFSQRAIGQVRSVSTMLSAEEAAKQAWLSNNPSSWDAPAGPASAPTPEEYAKQAWLARNKPDWRSPSALRADKLGHKHINVDEAACPPFVHAPLSYFAPELLTPKGTRRAGGSLVDVGEPEDFSRPLWKSGDGASVGSWACTQGGWDSPKLRATTEVFLVLDGEGSVTDTDGVTHPFGAGSVVVLPKHWSGRWDITAPLIHKVWLVHDHPDVPGAADGIVRAVVAPVQWFRDVAPESTRVAEGALHAAPAHAAHTLYDVGPTRVGFVVCAPGSFEVAPRPAAEAFFVVEGVFFLTNPDGSSRRCVGGDTVVLPKGWTGHWDVLEPVWKVWVEAE